LGGFKAKAIGSKKSRTTISLGGSEGLLFFTLQETEQL